MAGQITAGLFVPAGKGKNGLFIVRDEDKHHLYVFFSRQQANQVLAEYRQQLSLSDYEDSVNLVGGIFSFH